MTWDPQRYLNFAGPRLRPALDLLAQIRLDKANTIVDLGCGPGNITPYLRQRWPKAAITGVDASHEMLEAARQTDPAVTWVEANAATWKPAGRVDLIYANASLHWLGDHELLLPRLLGLLAPGGVLAIQMPRNFARPSHQLATRAAREAGVFEQLQHLFRPPPTHESAVYYDILAPHCQALDIWETDYLQPLTGVNPVAEWTGGSWLRPFAAALDGADRAKFVQTYQDLVARAYPPRSNGHTLLPYLRLFIVATPTT
ncbi:MAG: methyltransferase domain-containing protein [Nannocystaceae bacterium]